MEKMTGGQTGEQLPRHCDTGLEVTCDGSNVAPVRTGIQQVIHERCRRNDIARGVIVEEN